jgi:hypothetical protein
MHMPTSQSQNRYWSLRDYIISLYQQEKTQTPEFQAMLKIYGREKFEKWWFEFQAEIRKRHEKHQESFR